MIHVFPARSTDPDYLHSFLAADSVKSAIAKGDKSEAMVGILPLTGKCLYILGFELFKTYFPYTIKIFNSVCFGKESEYF